MKILFITHYDVMYGANMALLKLITALKQKGEEPMVVIPARGDFTGKLETMDVPYFISGVTQWQSEYSTALRFNVKKFLRKPKIKREVADILSQIGDQKIDIVHSNSSVVAHGAFIAKALNAKHIWHIREFSLEHFNMHYFYDEKTVKQLYEEASCLITISDALKNNYEKKYPKANIKRVYDGVSAKADSVYKKEAHDKFTFVYTAYLYSMKHQEQVIEAAEILKQQNITDFQIIFVGDGKPEYREYLENMTMNKGLTNISFAGYVKDVDGLLNKSDAGIIASEYEGFGLVTVEYMLHSLPVIGRDSGATPEIVCDEKTGIIYDNVTELAEAMKKIMKDKELSDKYGQAGNERARNCFTEDQNLSEVMKVYDSV